MAEERINFTKEDIGAEILPILTSGLYKETLDALREYIQNAIDAKCTCIKIRITPDVITLIDDGLGMTATAAKNAMRFGISDKNPKTHVGFRGIGIYSSFHLCQTLEIFTKSDADPNTYKIIFDFEKIRNDLLKERELRKNGNPPSLYLEKLLEKSIHTKVEHEFILESRGTTVVLSGLLPEAHNKLNNWDEVSGYL